MVAVDAETSGLVDFAQDREAEVHVFDGDNGVFHQVLAEQFALDVGSDLFAVHAGYLDLAEYGEVDFAVAVDGIAGNALSLSRIITGASICCYCLVELHRDRRQIEQHGELRVAAADDDRDLVLGTDLDGRRRRKCYFALTGSEVLEIDDVLEALQELSRSIPGRSRSMIQDNELFSCLY